jgi:predicted PurR-regulated permease PerM
MIYFLGITSLLFLVGMIVFLRTSLKIQSINEQLTSVLEEQYEREQITKQTIEDLLQQLREIDLKGSFESDDEVGFVFNQIKNLIEQYNDTI